MNTNKPDLNRSGSNQSGSSEFDKNEFDQSGWIAQARQVLDESVDGLDAATLSRLNRARQAALTPRSRPLSQLWLPAGLAGACAMLLAVALWSPHRVASVASEPGHATMTSVDANSTDAADALGSEDSVEFYQDLDFYAWLDAQGKDGAG